MKKFPICKELKDINSIQKFKNSFKEAIINISPEMTEHRKRSINSSIKNNVIVNCIFYKNICWFSEQLKELSLVGEENYKNVQKIVESRWVLEIDDSELLNISSDETYCFGFNFKYIDIFPEEYEIRKITIKDLVSADVIEEAEHCELQKYIEETYTLDYDNEYKLNNYWNSKPENSVLDNIKIEVVFKDVDCGEKYGSVYSRVMYKSECIGIISQHGRWLTNYSYSTFNLPKWKEMIDVIIKESDIQDEQNITVINEDADLYDYVCIEGISEKTYK